MFGSALFSKRDRIMCDREHVSLHIDSMSDELKTLNATIQSVAHVEESLIGIDG